MGGDSVARDRGEGVADEDDFLRFRRELQAASTESLCDFVKNCSLETLLNDSDGVGFLGIAGSQVVDGKNRVALRSCVINPVVLLAASWVSRKAEPVTLSKTDESE